MRILFVTPYVPSLIRVRPLNFLRQLSLRHEVALVALVQGDPSEAEALDEVRRYCEEVHVLPLSRVGAMLSCCRRLLTSMPLQAAYTYTRSACDFLKEVAQRGNYDVVHVEHIRGAHLAEGVTNLPRVFDSVDCITRLLKQRLDRGGGVLQRMLSLEELLKMRAYEARVASGFDGVVITSDQDKRALEYLIRTYAAGPAVATGPSDLASERRRIRYAAEHLQDIRLGLIASGGVSVVRNGVDSDYFRPMDVPVDPHRILFSGKMSYFANVTAVQEFYKDVFPRIRRVVPDAQFTIVGSEPPDSVRRLADDPAVEVTGYVQDIRPHVASAAVVVCPLTIGVGIQNKVLEAMAMGKRVVASGVACKGIPDALHGKHLLQADDSERTAGMILDLLERPGQGLEMGERARALVQESYSWEAAARTLEGVYQQAVYARRDAAFCAT